MPPYLRALAVQYFSNERHVRYQPAGARRRGDDESAARMAWRALRGNVACHGAGAGLKNEI